MMADPIQPGTNPNVIFDLRSATRTREAVQWVEQHNRGYSQNQSIAPRIQTPSYFGFTEAGGIPARVGLHVGVASVQLWFVLDNTLTAIGQSISAVNLSSLPVGGNKWVGITWRGGAYHVDWEDC
jgi:hypothetical protein